MIKLYLFERNVFTASFFTPLSQQVIRNHISETEKSTKMRIFMKVHTQVGGEIGHSEGKNGIQGTTALDPTLPTDATHFSRTGVYKQYIKQYIKPIQKPSDIKQVDYECLSNLFKF